MALRHALLALMALFSFLLVSSILLPLHTAFYLPNPTLHTAVEMLGAIPAVSFAVLLLGQGRQGDLKDHLYPVALGFLAMGILDGFHAISDETAPGFAWLRSLAAIAGGLFPALVWLGWGRALQRLAFHYVVAALAGVIGIFFLLRPGALPALDGDGGFVVALGAINVIAGLLSFATCAYFANRHARSRDFEDLTFAAFYMVLGTAATIFPFSRLWDGEWWLWHVLRLIAYAFTIQYTFACHLNMLNGMKQEIAERARAEAALRESEQRFRVLVEHAPEAIVVFDVDRNRLVDANTNAERLFGYQRAQLLQRAPADLEPPFRPWPQAEATAALDGIRSKAEQVLAGVPKTFEHLIRNAAGEDILCEVRLIALPASDRRLIRASYIDITERKAAEAQIEFLAYHDALTRLPNRLLARDHMEMAMSYADRAGNKVALLFLDLDNFKTINDSLGHLVGDALLTAIAARLHDCIRHTDTLARLGGDEFLVILSDVHNTDVITDIAEHILDELAKPFDVQGHELSTSFSLGIAVYPDDGRDFDTLLMKADTAMYHAKDAGRNTYRYHTEKMNLDAVEHLQIRNSLRKALERGEFVLHYQPQIDLETMAITGAEALIRWNHPVFGLVAPFRFIPIAEDSGLIVPIGDWVIEEACRQAAEWRRAGLPPLTVAVNLSAVQFRRGHLEKVVRQALSASGLPPENLELELTESILIQDTEKVLAKVRELKALGVKLSVDDFGTGYSSLAYLKRFDVDKLKIDQSFVRDMVDDPNDAVIVRAIVQLARSLNLRTIAEGVEDKRILSALRRKGCDEAQGYWFSPPLPADAFARYLADGKGYAPAIVASGERESRR